MTAPMLRRTATCLRSRAEAVTADRWDGVGLWRLAAPDVLAELWAGVLDDVADVVDALSPPQRLVAVPAPASPGTPAQAVSDAAGVPEATETSDQEAAA